jgi:anti-sigma factor RsiW
MSEHPCDDLPGLLFGELNRAQVTAVSDHPATCDDCRRELAVLAATSASLRATARNAQMLPEAVPGVAAAEGAPAVQPHRVGRGSARAGRRRRPLIGLAAALALPWSRPRSCSGPGHCAPTGPAAPSRWPGSAPSPPAARPAWPATTATGG